MVEIKFGKTQNIMKMIAGTTSQLKLTILIFIWENFPKKGISGQKRKSRTCACVHCRYYIKLFRTGADRHNGILMSLLLLVAETIKQQVFSFSPWRCDREGDTTLFSF